MIQDLRKRSSGTSRKDESFLFHRKYIVTLICESVQFTLYSQPLEDIFMYSLYIGEGRPNPPATGIVSPVM